MSNVFVTGAGYIGNAVAIALRQAGHNVTVLVRSSNKATELLKNEVRVVEGDLKNTAGFQKQIEEASYIVDASGDLQSVYGLFAAIEKASEKSPKSKTFVYTSGILVYGDNPNKILDETSPVASVNLHPWSKARHEFEQKLLNSTLVRTVILRPGFVYGNSSGGLGHMAFGGPLKGQFTIVGNPQNRFSYTHVIDLADAYRRVVEAPVSVIDKEVFNVVDYSHPTNDEMLHAAAKVAGFTGKPEYKAASSDFEKFADASCACSPLKTIRLLGWTPRHLGFIEEIELYFKSYKAAHGIP